MPYNLSNPEVWRHFGSSKPGRQFSTTIKKRADHLESTPLSVLIVADDLTGACDAAAPFACRGAGRPSSVRAVSTESRDLAEPECVRRLEALAERAASADILFKKIDSTLRGNVHAEIRAAMHAFHCECAIVTPAFPEMGRTVKNNWLFLHGQPAKTAGENVLDAETDQDLDRIVEEGLCAKGRVLWAGSAGLAAALARRLYGPPVARSIPMIEGPIALCIGSNHPVTLAQQAELERCQPDVWVVPVPVQRTPASAQQIREALRGQPRSSLPAATRRPECCKRSAPGRSSSWTRW